MSVHEGIAVLGAYQRRLSLAVAHAQLEIRQELEAKGQEPYKYGQQRHPDDEQTTIVYSEDRSGEPQARRFVTVEMQATIEDPDKKYKTSAK